MASIFTFDPDPPRVASPWSNSGMSIPDRMLNRGGNGRARDEVPSPPVLDGSADDDIPITKLEAEPQEGPIEYKLHLLLRPRRNYYSTTTGSRIAGSNHPGLLEDAQRRTVESRLPATPPLASSSPSRQHRLEQLTTQLLWRLQQSSPHHASGSSRLISPSFPDISAGVMVKQQVGRALPGLEDSQGALYEIGVADDGTFIGLTHDELDESLHNLRAMAATLGCTVEVWRKVAVGECEWFEECDVPYPARRSQSTLWVAEAFVKPNLGIDTPDASPEASVRKINEPELGDRTEGNVPPPVDVEQSLTEQLRITLTGATMSGKSSLLGSLSNATLDNGRGKSRLSLLKHRHEIASGMTSSVTQELLGYSRQNPVAGTRIINYASADVSSWYDIHTMCEGSRLAFLSDSAGHPRYRRTTIRGLVGWRPHWTLLCVPADNAEDTSESSASTPPLKELLGCGSTDLDVSEAYLQICLELDLPLVVAITKLDLASKAGLRQVLHKFLTRLKAAGRKPLIVPDSPGVGADSESLQVDSKDTAAVHKILDQENATSIVPIILTSAVKGTGIRKLHALLNELPIPAVSVEDPLTSPPCTAETALFHVEDVYHERSALSNSQTLTVVGGLLAHGAVKIGDELVVGPFAVDPAAGDVATHPISAASFTPRSFPGALGKTDEVPIRQSVHAGEWRRVKVVSLRNLRLPVRCLRADQVGTIGLQSLSEPISSAALSKLRKGMILSSGSPTASSSLEAEFAGKAIRALSVGSTVTVYTSSVRATAKIIYIAVRGEDSYHGAEDALDFDGSDDGFADQHSPVDGSPTTVVRFGFSTTREFVEPGVSVLALTGGGPGLTGGGARGVKGLAGFDGFVGKVLRGLREQRPLTVQQA